MKGEEIGECITLYIPQNKSREFWEIVEGSGYKKDSSGVLKFILETDTECEGEIPEEENIAITAFRDWADKNPEDWLKAKEKGSTVMRNLLSKVIRKI